ncbi:hypothetical protein HK100_008921, partial [Physocladia obscura]
MVFHDLSKEEFPSAIREIMRVTQNGGWIELVELDFQEYRTGPLAKSINAAFSMLLIKRKLDLLAGTNLE